MDSIVVKINGKQMVFNPGTYVEEALIIAGINTSYSYVLDEEGDHWSLASASLLNGDDIYTVEYKEGGSLYASAAKSKSPYTCSKISVPELEIRESVSGRCEPTPTTNKKEDINMSNNIMGKIGLQFGKVTDYRLKTSINGIAIMTDAGKYVAYNPKDGSLTDVTDLLIDFGGDFVFALPVAKDDIEVGDLIKKDSSYYYVKEVTASGSTIVVNPHTSKEEILVPQKNIFGFNFVTKIVNLFQGFGGTTASAENPFGNMMLPLLLSGGEIDTNTILMLSMGLGNGTNDMSSMLPLLLMKDGGNDMLPLMLMMQGGSNPFESLFGGKKKTGPVVPTPSQTYNTVPTPEATQPAANE